VAGVYDHLCGSAHELMGVPHHAGAALTRHSSMQASFEPRQLSRRSNRILRQGEASALRGDMLILPPRVVLHRQVLVEHDRPTAPRCIEGMLR
jgi:hypothetical protein